MTITKAINADYLFSIHVNFLIEKRSKLKPRKQLCYFNTGRSRAQAASTVTSEARPSAASSRTSRQTAVPLSNTVSAPALT